MKDKNLKIITASQLYNLVDFAAVKETKDYIQENKIELKKSTKYNILIDNDLYPPKDFLRVLAKLKGYKIDENTFFGGKANGPFKKLNYRIMSKNDIPSYNKSKLESLIKKYQYAIDKTEWLRLDEIYKFKFINWIEENIDFDKDSNEVIRQKIDESQRISFTPNSNEKGVNFLQTIVRYQDDYITLEDLNKLKQVVSGEKTISKDNLKLSFKSYPKTSAYLSFFNPIKFIAYDAESMPSYQYLSSGSEGHIIPKSGFKAFQFYQIFYNNIKEDLKNSQLNISIFKELLNVDVISELQWNFIAQDFLLFITREIMNSDNAEEEENVMVINIGVDNLNQPLNQILYGPPGTGKTYNTKKIAVEIIDGSAPEERTELIKRYNALIESGQIQFTTFHQSMSYEDFIEGIKPQMSENNEGDLQYEIKPGIFKRICDTASANTSSNFSTAYARFLKDFAETEDEYLDLKTPRGKQYSLKLNSNNNLTLFTTINRNQYGTLTSDRLNDFYLGKPSLTGWEGYATGFIKYLENNYKLNKADKKPNDKYVLIIDEINRGNVSAIFGELITLLEDDKREGKEEALEAILPYSKTPFSIPSNVYIIGTMNTADRSVEALDTALRRRFSFKEIGPQPELLLNVEFEDVDLALMLKTINERIELLIDKDHQIGHSYLMNVKTLDDLRVVFRDKIIPLLEEYFYGDFGKIGLILGNKFVQQKVNANENIFADFKPNDANFLLDKQLFSYVKSIEHMEIDDFKSIYSKVGNE